MSMGWDYLVTEVFLQQNHTFVDQAIAMGVAPKLASLVYALLYVVIIWIPTHQLFKRKIYIKL